MDRLHDILMRSPAFRQLVEGALARSPAHSTVLEVPDLSVGRAVADSWLAHLYCPAAPDAGRPCGTCRDCVQVREGSHPGVVPVEPDGNVFRVEQVRDDVLALVGERVPGGRHQVFVLLRSEAMNEESGNALLKVVEEPPPRTLFLLVTEDRERLLGTIRSRSREVTVLLPGVEELLESLGEARAPAAAGLLAAGYAPALLARLEEAAGLPAAPVAGALDELAGRGPEVLGGVPDSDLLRDPRASAHSPEVAELLFRTGLELATLPTPFVQRAHRAHAFADGSARVAESRGEAMLKAHRKEHGEALVYPVLKRVKQFARQAATRAAEDLMRAVVAALAASLRVRAGHDPCDLAGRYPELRELAAAGPALLLHRARRVRRARRPLYANQNLRMLLEELLADLGELTPLAAPPAGAGAPSGRAHG